MFVTYVLVLKHFLKYLTSKLKLKTKHSTRSPISFQQVNYGDGNSMTSELLTSQEESEEAVTLLQSVEMKTPQFAFVSLLACLPQLKTESCSLALSIFQVDFFSLIVMLKYTAAFLSS